MSCSVASKTRIRSRSHSKLVNQPGERELAEHPPETVLFWAKLAICCPRIPNVSICKRKDLAPIQTLCVRSISQDWQTGQTFPTSPLCSLLDPLSFVLFTRGGSLKRRLVQDITRNRIGRQPRALLREVNVIVEHRAVLR